MESLSSFRILHHSIPFHLQISYPLKPLISLKPLNVKPPYTKTLSPLRCSGRPPPPSLKILKCLSRLLRPTVLSLTTAAAVILSRHSLQSLAAAAPTPVRSPPTAQSESLSAGADESNEHLLEEHLRSHPNDIDSLRVLLHVKVKQQKLLEAISVVDRLMLIDPSDSELYLLKAHLHSYCGNTDKAREGFEEILSANPFVAEAYHGLVMAASLSGDSKALGGIVERVQGVIKRCEEEKKRGELMDLKILVAQVRMIEGDYQEALRIYQEMAKEEPRDFRPYLCQGIVYTLMKKSDEAEKNFNQYRKLVPKNHPFAQLFQSNLSGMNASLKMNRV